MECLCVEACYLAHEGRIAQYRKGDLIDFKECPPHFVELNSATIDLEEASEEVLLASDIEADDIREFANERYGLRLSKRLRRETVITKFVKVRDRFMEAPKDWSE